MTIAIAASEPELRKCFPVMNQLRPHLTLDAFLGQVRRQGETAGYVLAYCEEDGAVRAAAGYRIAEYLAWGRILYIDDLITDASARGRGHGGRLMDWLILKAKEQGCAQVHLDSGVHRFDAHRLYLNKRMIISSHHFSREL